MRLHIGANGQPAPCKAAEGACPLGEATIHGDFDSVADATGWAEEFHAKKAGGTFGDGLSKENIKAKESKQAVYEVVKSKWDEFGVELDELDLQDFRVSESLPFDGLEDLNDGFQEAAKRQLKENYDEASRKYANDFSDGEAAEDGFVEEYSQDAEYEVMDEALYNLLGNDSRYDLATSTTTVEAVGIEGLHRGPDESTEEYNERKSKLRDLPLKPIAQEYVLSKEYDDSNYAEPSNVLKVISSENPKVELNASSFPVDGRREADWGSFKADGVEFSYEAKRDKVWITAGSGDKTYEFSFEESGDGYGLKDNLETVIKNAKGIANFAKSGRASSEFTRKLERFGGNL